MLKQIATAEVALGMYVHALEGSWLKHPFWKTKFVVNDPSELAALRASGVAGVWIDTSRGCDVVAPTAWTAPQAQCAGPEVQPVRPSPSKAPPPVRRESMDGELEKATQIVNRSRQAVTALFGEARLGHAVDAEQCLPLVEEVAASVARNPSALISLARLKTRDDYTYMHSVAVCALMVGLSRQLGLDEATTREAGLAGLLHDIGKMVMPLDVLNKPGALTDAEFTVMRSHPERGYEALKEGASVPECALDVCLHHHEKIDGTGYPHKLAGEQISQLARMAAVCDVYDAITSTRPYKAAWDPAGSIQRMSQWPGQFDPAIFQAFVKSVGIYPTGTLVKMQSGRLAVVVEQNPGALVAPIVRVFYSTKSKMPIPVQLIDLSASGATDRIAGRESPQDWGFTYLDDLWRKPDAHA